MANIYRVYPRQRKSIFSKLNVTLTLIIINVLFFLVISIVFPNQTEIIGEQEYRVFNEFVSKNIAISLENIQELRIWTFLTSIFMHANFFHLFANMVSLFFIGSLIERILGSKRFLWFYLAAGIFAGLLFVLWELSFPSGMGAVGASGALFGVAGLMILLTPNLPLFVMFIPIPIKAKYAIPGLLVVLWLISLAAGLPIGNVAHFGGLVAGVVYGFYLKEKYPRKTKMIGRYFS